MYYKCNYFGIYELVSPDVYSVRQEQAWSLFDLNALITLDRLRKRYGKIIVNDWFWGGSYMASGFRPSHSRIGAMYSQHKYGRAFDCKFKEVTVAEVRQDCLQNPDLETFEMITAIELRVNWFHFDTRNIVNVKRIFAFSA